MIARLRFQSFSILFFFYSGNLKSYWNLMSLSVFNDSKPPTAVGQPLAWESISQANWQAMKNRWFSRNRIASCFLTHRQIAPDPRPQKAWLFGCLRAVDRFSTASYNYLLAECACGRLWSMIADSYLWQDRKVGRVKKENEEKTGIPGASSIRCACAFSRRWC